jgi:outer membrane protein insertion porin family
MKRLAGLLLTAALCAAVGAAEVGEVRFEQSGADRLSEVQMVLNTRLRKGAEYRREYLDEDIKRLYRTGNFADVEASVDELADGKVRVVFKLRLKPRISSLKLVGNAKFSTHDLSKELTLAEGGLLNDLELRKTLNNLRKFYHDRGYKDASVSFAQIADGPGRAALTIKITENLRLKVDDVTFEGTDRFSQWDLRHSIANQFSYFNYLPFLNDFLNYGLLDRAELETDKARLRDKYHDAGYLDFKVEEVALTPREDDPEYVNIHFKIHEGEPYKIGTVSVSGNTTFETPVLLERILLKSDETFSREKEEASTRAICALYDTLGYADVYCKALRSEDVENHVVNVTFEVSEGRKYHVRDVLIVGNTDTRDKVIRRELAIQPGDPVDRNRIDVSRARLMGMGYFQKVEATSVNADSPDEKDVRITVEEKPTRYNLRIGAGASDVNKVFGMAEISTDNFDLTNPKNLFYGGGQRLRLQGFYGVDNAGFNADFVEPWLFDLPIRFELSGYMNLVDYENWDEWHIGGRTSLQKKIFDDFTTIAVGYKFEVVRVIHVDKKLKDYFKREDLSGTFLVSQPSIMLARDTRDSLTDPTEGYNINLFGSITPRVFGSSRDYYRLEAKGSYYYSFFDKAIIAMVGAKIGTVATFRYDNDVPVFERYFLGGGDSLRGFEYRTVSPTHNKKPIGGQSMLLVTAEVSHPIWGPLRGAAFVDVGGVWADSYSMNFSSINMGAGYGLRLKLPWLNIPIRLDLAYPVINNTDHEKSRIRLHFNVGFTF